VNNECSVLQVRNVLASAALALSSGISAAGPRRHISSRSHCYCHSPTRPPGCCFTCLARATTVTRRLPTKRPSHAGIPPACPPACLLLLLLARPGSQYIVDAAAGGNDPCPALHSARTRPHTARSPRHATPHKARHHAAAIRSWHTYYVQTEAEPRR
jgi:hypothetical protein